MTKQRPVKTPHPKGQGKWVYCLGWCGCKFKSDDPATIRFCPRCRPRFEENRRSRVRVVSLGRENGL